jgi:signal transduction histidine kinase
LRIICTCLAAFLIFYKNWPLYLKKYLPHIWLLTISICLPFFFVSLLIINKFSIFSVISLFAAISFLLLITSFQEFIFSTLSGTLTALLTYRLLIGNIDIQLASENLSSVLSNLIAILLIGYCVALKRDEINSLITKELKQTQTYSTDLEMILQTQNKELATALKAKERFLNNVNHELRTPLHSVLAFSTFLKDKFKDISVSKNEYCLEQIINNASRMNTLVSDLLDLASLKNHTKKPNKENIYIPEIAQQTSDILRDLYNTKISVTYDASENLWCYCDKYKIKQVLEHLILNAIKFSHNKPIAIKIEKHKYYLKILVIDQGIGVDNSDGQIIFEEFEEGSLTKTAAGGKGIGLAICKHIISAHSGYISVNNNKDSGCTFTVSLPTKN